MWHMHMQCRQGSPPPRPRAPGHGMTQEGRPLCFLMPVPQSSTVSNAQPGTTLRMAVLRPPGWPPAVCCGGSLLQHGALHCQRCPSSHSTQPLAVAPRTCASSSWLSAGWRLSDCGRMTVRWCGVLARSAPLITAALVPMEPLV